MARRSLPKSSFPTAWTGPLRLLVVLVLLIALGALTARTLASYFTVRETELPNLVGLPRDEATRILSALKLSPLTFAENSAALPVNAVTSQSPSPGTVVREGRGISLGVNEASGNAQVPDLFGSAQTQARTLLVGLGLELGEVSYVFDDAPKDQIIQQRPAVAEQAALGSRVDVTVSRGPDIAARPLPNVQGSNVEAAKAQLRALGFVNVDTLASSVSFDRPFTVTDQLPAAGQSVPLSTRVTLFYSLSSDTVTEVPNLTGVSLSQAQLMLRGAGLSLAGFTYIDDPAQPPGVVRYEPGGFTLSSAPVAVTINRAGSLGDQDAEAGVWLTPEGALDGGFAGTGFDSTGFESTEFTGTEFSVGTETVSTEILGTETPGSEGSSASNQRSIRFDFDPSQLGMSSLQREPYRLTLVVSDEQGERTVLDQVVPPGQSVNTSVEVYGEALLQTFLNDIFFQAWNP